MGKSIKKKAIDERWNKEECRTTINRHGLYRLAEEKDIGIPAARNYAEDKDWGLGIKDPPLFTENATKPNSQLAREIISALYAIYSENLQLKEELRQTRREDAKKDALAKVQLIEMLDSVKMPKVEEVFDYCPEE